MHLAILSCGTGWHVADLARACRELGHRATPLDFRRLAAGVASAPEPLAGFDAVIVRTMPQERMARCMRPSPQPANDLASTPGSSRPKTCRRPVFRLHSSITAGLNRCGSIL